MGLRIVLPQAIYFCGRIIPISLTSFFMAWWKISIAA